MVLREPITRSITQSLDYPITKSAASEPWRQVEMEDPVFLALHRVGERELAEREAEEVDAERSADARDALGLSAEYFRCRGTRPCHAGIGEQRDLDGERPIHARGRAERSQQREPELEVRDQ